MAEPHFEKKENIIQLDRNKKKKYRKKKNPERLVIKQYDSSFLLYDVI